VGWVLLRKIFFAAARLQTRLFVAPHKKEDRSNMQANNTTKTLSGEPVGGVLLFVRDCKQSDLQPGYNKFFSTAGTGQAGRRRRACLGERPCCRWRPAGGRQTEPACRTYRAPWGSTTATIAFFRAQCCGAVAVLSFGEPKKRHVCNKRLELLAVDGTGAFDSKCPLCSSDRIRSGE
jgi:hypothetical protein